MSTLDSPTPNWKFNVKNHVLYYLFTYLFMFLLAILNVLVLVFVKPFERSEFSLTDLSISHRVHNSDLVHFSVVIVVFTLIPILIVATFCLLWYFKVIKNFDVQSSNFHSEIKNKNLQRSLRYLLLNDPLHHFQLFFQTMIMSQLFTLLITTLLKLSVGRLRPDFLDRCNPEGWNTTDISVLTSFPPPLLTCRGDPAIINEGRVSFPSGHASSSFTGAFVWAAWIFLVLHRARCDFSSKDFFFSVWFKAFLAMIPLSYASYIGISRIEQMVHHPTDVIAGAVIGAFIGLFFFYFVFLEDKEIRVRNEVVSEAERERIMNTQDTV
ncbi:hypothetical protein HDU92_007845 [Lobulomyces angularis]|nr:hypothetical protein HDU92_007845 [Lobulomyces angularis]